MGYVGLAMALGQHRAGVVTTSGTIQRLPLPPVCCLYACVSYVLRRGQRTDAGRKLARRQWGGWPQVGAAAHPVPRSYCPVPLIRAK